MWCDILSHRTRVDLIWCQGSGRSSCETLTNSFFPKSYQRAGQIYCLDLLKHGRHNDWQLNCFRSFKTIFVFRRLSWNDHDLVWCWKFENHTIDCLTVRFTLIVTSDMLSRGVSHSRIHLERCTVVLKQWIYFYFVWRAFWSSRIQIRHRESVSDEFYGLFVWLTFTDMIVDYDVIGSIFWLLPMHGDGRKTMLRLSDHSGTNVKKPRKWVGCEDINRRWELSRTKWSAMSR
jgi:hypothetical protein